jgi:hypothetical protein
LKEYFYVKGEPSKYSNAGIGTFEKNIESGSPPSIFAHYKSVKSRKNI